MMILPKSFVDSVDEFIESWQSKNFESVDGIVDSLSSLIELTEQIEDEYQVWEKDGDP